MPDKATRHPIPESQLGCVFRVNLDPPLTDDPPRGRLTATTLYIGDNGRVFCGTLRCAGANAFFSGRGTSGLRVRIVPPRRLNEPLYCETCGYDGINESSRRAK